MATTSSRYPSGLSEAESPLTSTIMSTPKTETMMLMVCSFVGGSFRMLPLKINVTIGTQAITVPLSEEVVSAMPQVSPR